MNNVINKINEDKNHGLLFVQVLDFKLQKRNQLIWLSKIFLQFSAQKQLQIDSWVFN